MKIQAVHKWGGAGTELACADIPCENAVMTHWTARCLFWRTDLSWQRHCHAISNHYLFFFLFSFCKTQEGDASYHHFTPLLLKTWYQSYSLRIKKLFISRRLFWCSGKSAEVLDLFLCEKGRLETITSIRTQLKSNYTQTPNSFQFRKYYQIKITIIHQRFGNIFLWKVNCLYAIKIFRHTSRPVKFCSRRSATPWIQLILSNYSYIIKKVFLTMRKVWYHQS